VTKRRNGEDSLFVDAVLGWLAPVRHSAIPEEFRDQDGI